MTTTATSLNHRLPESPVCADTWIRAEKVAFPESSSTQPDFLPLGGSGNEDSSLNEQNYTLSNSTVPSLAKRKRLLSNEVVQSCTPWRTKEYTCDPPGLHEEICDFYTYMKPRPSEVRMRSEVIMRVMQIILNRWPLARVEVFGSFYTGTFLPTSDIDIVVFGQWPGPRPPLFSLEDDFKMNDIAVEGSILVLDKTSIPIIKFIDKMTEVKVDISFNQQRGMDSAEIITTFIQQYPLLPKLLFVLKQFLTQRQLNEIYHGGISSYSLVLLIVSFLQRHPREAATEPDPNLGVLLIEFFELYGRNFNYMKTGIDVSDGGRYFPKEDVQCTDGSDNSLLYVIDPADPKKNANASKGCFGMWQVKQAFEYAFVKLHSAVISRDNPIPKRDSLLGAIIKVTQEVDEYRNWVDSNWPPHPLSPPIANPAPYFYQPLLPVVPILSPYVPLPQQPYATIIAMSSTNSTTDPSIVGHTSNHVATTSSGASSKSSTGTSVASSKSGSSKDESSNS